MLSELKTELSERIAERISELFDLEHEPVVEVPPRRELGDLAFPAALHLARELRRKPRDIATELAEGLELPSYVQQVRVEGAGYLNFFLDRGVIGSRLLADSALTRETVQPDKAIVEHTNINPNKAAHIGHLRNAVLGDTLARALKSLGYPVEVQNYIDDTGVQVAGADLKTASRLTAAVSGLFRSSATLAGVSRRPRQ